MRRGSRAAILLGIGGVALAMGAGALAPMALRAHRLHPVTGQPLTTPGQDGDATLLFNGWKISPVGRSLPTGDMLEGGAISPDGKTLALANGGYNANALHLVDLATEKEVASLPVSRTSNGIAWSADSARLYVAGGITDAYSDVFVYNKTADGQWEKGTGFKIKAASANQRRICGLALSPDGKTLFALNQYDQNLYLLNTADGSEIAHLTVGDHPTACRLAADGNTLYVANLGGAEVVAVDVSAPSTPKITQHFATGDHPNDLAFSSDGRLFVSCGNADCVSVIQPKTGRVIETIKTRLTARAPSGSTPNAVAVSPDGKSLYVADADNNNVCVIDIATPGKSRVRGFIPTGWYPTAVLTTPDGKRLIVGSGKGTGTGPNPVRLPIPPEAPGGFEHHGRQLKGLISFVDMPDDATLAAYTKTVLANSPYRDSELKTAVSEQKTAIPTQVGAPSPIKYILYIIKENRTYDQVFGDETQGNGDPKLCLFGRDVTPNEHALSEQFVLLDNLYCNGEVSQDGHPWCVSAYCTDFTQRTWVDSYSGKGETQGSYSVEDPDSDYIWQACKKKGISYRAYGEYATHKTLSDQANQEFIGKGKPGSPPPGRDMDKADIFLAEYNQLLGENKVPRFMIMSLGEDHTSGTRVGAHTPKAMVASNDQAIGKIVEGISHSKLWKEFAIFIIEDDAQNGPDHIDSHRTTGLVISPYIRRRTVDSTMYSTTSMLRTMELILGLPPLTQYDAAATPMFASFSNTADLTPYTLLPPRIDLTAVNKPGDYGAARSAKMDFSGYDRVNEDDLNDILWHSIKGANVPMPAPVRSARFTPQGSAPPAAAKKDDDD